MRHWLFLEFSSLPGRNLLAEVNESASVCYDLGLTCVGERVPLATGPHIPTELRCIHYVEEMKSPWPDE